MASPISEYSAHRCGMVDVRIGGRGNTVSETSCADWPPLEIVPEADANLVFELVEKRPLIAGAVVIVKADAE